MTSRRPMVAARPRSATNTLSFPLFVGAVHLVIVQLAASLAYRYGTSNSPSPPYQTMPPPHDGLANLLVDPLRTWDGLWYRLVALETYAPVDEVARERGFGFAKAAFWPLFPWTMRAVSDLTGISTDVAGYVIANVCFFIALILLYKLIELDFDDRIARGTLWALALFPTAFFFSAVYTESPFLMMVVGSLLAARRGNWWLAGAVGALAALTRSYGMFLMLPLAVLFIQDRGFYLRRMFPTGLAVGLPLLGPAIFSWHLDRVWGDPWGWRTVQNQWNRFSAMPWETMEYAFSQSPEGERIGVKDGADWGWISDLFNNLSWSTVTSEPWRKAVADSDTLELVCTLLFFALALVGLWKLPLYQSVYLIPGLAVPLFQPSSVHALMSMPRFGLTLFPLFVVIAILLAGRPVIARPLAVLSTLLLIVFTIQFAHWYWVS